MQIRCLKQKRFKTDTICTQKGKKKLLQLIRKKTNKCLNNNSSGFMDGIWNG